MHILTSLALWSLPLFLIILLKSREQWVSADEEEVESIIYLDDETNETCPINYYHCNYSHQCVPPYMRCNAKVDCNDFMDEFGCDDIYIKKGKNPDDVFNRLFKKSTRSKREDIPRDECFVQPVLSVACGCDGYDILCDSLNLSTIPTDIPTEPTLSLYVHFVVSGIVFKLDFSGNQFPYINDTFLDSLSHTDELILTNCGITTISRHAFRRISDVIIHSVDLASNHIKYFNHTIFSKGNKVENLTLSRNGIIGLHAFDFLNLRRLYELDLRHNLIEEIDAEIFKPLINLESLYISWNRITHLDSFSFPPLNNLFYLNLAHNRIYRIDDKSFKFPNLKLLYLTGNRLTEIQGRTFCGCKRLAHLTLNDNNLRVFDLRAFDCLLRLTQLFLAKNDFETLDKRILENLPDLQYITFETADLCQYAPPVETCEPNTKGFKSEYRLLQGPMLRGRLYIIAFITIVANAWMFVIRIGKPTYTGFSPYLIHLAVSGFLMGLYLVVIAIADVTSQGKYIINDLLWRQSKLCTFAGFLSVLSYQSTTVFLLIATWDQLLFVARPMYAKLARQQMLKFNLRLGILWTISVILAAIPLLPIEYFSGFYGENGFCMPLYLGTPYAKGWEYSLVLFLCIHICSLLFIHTFHVRMRKARKLLPVDITLSSAKGSENIVDQKFDFIVFTCRINWLLIIVMKLVALAYENIEYNAYSWISLLIIPINSALTPIFYLILTLMMENELGPFQAPPEAYELEDRPTQQSPAEHYDPSTSYPNAPRLRDPNEPSIRYANVPSTSYGNAPSTRYDNAPSTSGANDPYNRNVNVLLIRDSHSPSTRDVSAPRTRDANTPSSRDVSVSRTRASYTPSSREVSVHRTRRSHSPRTRDVSAPRTRDAITPSTRSSNAPSTSAASNAIPSRRVRRHRRAQFRRKNSV